MRMRERILRWTAVPHHEAAILNRKVNGGRKELWGISILFTYLLKSIIYIYYKENEVI
jgi:hypothetical protein